MQATRPHLYPVELQFLPNCQIIYSPGQYGLKTHVLHFSLKNLPLGEDNDLYLKTNRKHIKHVVHKKLNMLGFDHFIELSKCKLQKPT